MLIDMTLPDEVLNGTTLIDEVREVRRLLGRASEIRREAGVLQERMAREIGVDRTAIGRWEAGKVRPTGLVGERYVALLRELESLLTDE